MNMRIALLFFIFFLYSCTNTENKDSVVATKKFKTRCMEIDLPISYNIDSTRHWDMGKIYHVKNSENKEILFFYSGWQTSFSRDFDWKSLTDSFIQNNRIDTIEEWNGKILKRQITVLQAKLCPQNGHTSDMLFPLVVEFSCYPDFADALTCEEIISSARIKADKESFRGQSDKGQVQVPENFL